MAHFTRTQPDATWTTGNYVTLANDWASLDSKIRQSVNGDLGGCWAPSSPIIINGGAGTNGFDLSALLVIDYGGSFTVSTGAQISLSGIPGAGDGLDYPLIYANHVGRTRTIITPCYRRMAQPLFTWCNHAATGGVQSIACTVQIQSETSYDYITGNYFPVDPSILQPRFALPLRVHDGARFVSATLTFRVSTPRLSPPVVAPRMRIVRADSDGTLTPLKSTASGADADGFVPIASPSSGPAWYAGGLVQSFTYLCDQANTIDKSQYTYWAELIEETGTLKPVQVQQVDGVLVREMKLPVNVASSTNITRNGLQTVDGVVMGNTSYSFGALPDRVLLTNQIDKTQNGIYIAINGTAWSRALELDTPSDFTPGFLVPVIAGTSNGGSIWECTAPTNTQPIKIADQTGSPISFQRRTGRGNIYHSVAAHFDSIIDMRPQ